MPFQIIASILMIITLYIYHGYETNVDQSKMDEALTTKTIAIILLYFSRFLSGFAAGRIIVIECFWTMFQDFL